MGLIAKLNQLGTRIGIRGTDVESQHVANLIFPPVSVAATAAGSVTPDFSLSNDFQYLLTGNLTIANPVNPADGRRYSFRLKQDATGSRTLTLGSKFKVPGGTALVLSTAANASDLLEARYIASDDIYLTTLTKAFS